MNKDIPEWERIVRGMMQNELIEAQFIDKIVDVVSSQIQEAEKRGAERVWKQVRKTHDKGFKEARNLPPT